MVDHGVADVGPVGDCCRIQGVQDRKGDWDESVLSFLIPGSRIKDGIVEPGAARAGLLHDSEGRLNHLVTVFPGSGLIVAALSDDSIEL